MEVKDSIAVVNPQVCKHEGNRLYVSQPNRVLCDVIFSVIVIHKMEKR